MLYRGGASRCSRGTILEGDGEGGLTAKEWKDRRRRLKALGDKAPPTPWLADVEP